MPIKTREFNIKFINDVQQIIFESKKYREGLSRIHPGRDPNYIIETKGLFENVTFIGSYAKKKYGDVISDIDIRQKVKYINENLISRLRQIISNLRSSSTIKFIRFYCGSRENIRIPWSINEEGYFIFELDKTFQWINNLRKYIPLTLQNFLESKLNYTAIGGLDRGSAALRVESLQEKQGVVGSTYISIKELLEIEKMLEPYIELSWSENDIINGYKIDDIDGIRYDLLDTLKKNRHRKNVIKYIYIYTHENGPPEGRAVHGPQLSSGPILGPRRLTGEQLGTKEYCLIDMSINFSIINNQMIYYMDDSYKKFKSLNFHLPENIKYTYRDEMTRKIGPILFLHTNIELINKIQKYNNNNRILSSNDVILFIKRLVNYSLMNNIHIDSNNLKESETKLKNIINLESDKLYKKYRKLITDPNHIKMIYRDEIRGDEGSIPVDISCIYELGRFPFFNSKDLNTLIDISFENNIDTFKFINCIRKSSFKYKKNPIELAENYIFRIKTTT